jgi:hypothetical protein
VKAAQVCRLPARDQGIPEAGTHRINPDRARSPNSARDQGAKSQPQPSYGEISQRGDRVEEGCLATGGV